MMTENELLEKSINFLQEIGIVIAERELKEEDCFLPGCMIENGVIIIDRNKLLYPGDILHEAGHLAVIPASERSDINGPQIALRTDREAEEMMALAWSYAACIHLKIDPHFVFHEHGYKEGGANLVENFNEGRYIGVPVLQWLGMTTTDTSKGVPVYPAMIRWLRD